MKIACGSLLLGASLTAFGQSMISKQIDAVNPPFTLTIAAYQSNFNEENTAEQIVKDSISISIRIRKTNISDHEILKLSYSSGVYGYHRGYWLEVRDSNGNLVGPRNPNVPTSGGGAWRGTTVRKIRCHAARRKQN
jgi:hypothetical protein